MSKLDRTKMGKAKAHRCFSTPKISSSITSRGTNHSEGSRGNSRVAPTTDSLAGGGPIAPASPSPERGERSPSQEWRQQLASSYYALLLGPRAPVRETRRSSSASDLTRCSRSRMACLETDWVGKSRRGQGRRRAISDAQVFGCHHPNIATTRHEQKIVMWTPIVIQYRIGVASL